MSFSFEVYQRHSLRAPSVGASVTPPPRSGDGVFAILMEVISPQQLWFSSDVVASLLNRWLFSFCCMIFGCRGLVIPITACLPVDGRSSPRFRQKENSQRFTCIIDGIQIGIPKLANQKLPPPRWRVFRRDCATRTPETVTLLHSGMWRCGLRVWVF
jgi:hypothetical protein